MKKKKRCTTLSFLNPMQSCKFQNYCHHFSLIYFTSMNNFNMYNFIQVTFTNHFSLNSVIPFMYNPRDKIAIYQRNLGSYLLSSRIPLLWSLIHCFTLNSNSMRMLLYLQINLLNLRWTQNIKANIPKIKSAGPHPRGSMRRSTGVGKP